MDDADDYLEDVGKFSQEDPDSDFVETRDLRRPETEATAETGAEGRTSEVAESREVVTRKEAFANQQNAKESGGLFSRKKLVVREVETEGGKFYETTSGQLVSTDSKGVQVVSSGDQRFWAFDESLLQGVELETITPEQAFRHAQITGTLGPDGQLIVRDVPGGEGYVQTVTSSVVSKAELQQAGIFQTQVIVESPTNSIFENTEDFAALAQRGSAGTESVEAVGGGVGTASAELTPVSSASIEVTQVSTTSAELSEVVDDVGNAADDVGNAAETTGGSGSVEDLTRSVEADTPTQGTTELAEANPPPQTQATAEVAEVDTAPQGTAETAEQTGRVEADALDDVDDADDYLDDVGKFSQEDPDSDFVETRHLRRPETEATAETGAEGRTSEVAESREVVTRKEALANQQNAKESGGLFSRKKLVVREVETEGGRFYETSTGQLLSTDSKTGLQVVESTDTRFTELDYSRLDLDTVRAQAGQVRLQTNLGAPPPGIEPPPLPSEVTQVSSVSAEVTPVPSAATAEVTPVSTTSIEVTPVSTTSAELSEVVDDVGNAADDVGNAAETTGGSGSVEDLTRSVEADASPQTQAVGDPGDELVDARTLGSTEGAGDPGDELVDARTLGSTESAGDPGDEVVDARTLGSTESAGDPGDEVVDLSQTRSEAPDYPAPPPPEGDEPPPNPLQFEGDEPIYDDPIVLSKNKPLPPTPPEGAESVASGADDTVSAAAGNAEATTEAAEQSQALQTVRTAEAESSASNQIFDDPIYESIKPSEAPVEQSALGDSSIYDDLIYDEEVTVTQRISRDSGNLQRSQSLPDLRTSEGAEGLTRSKSLSALDDLDDADSFVPEPLAQSQTGRTETASRIVSFEEAVDPAAGNEVAEGKLIVRPIDQGYSPGSQTSLSSDFVETTSGQLVDVSDLPEGRYEIVTQADPSFSELDAAKSAARAAEQQRVSQLSLEDLPDIGRMRSNSLSGSLENFDVDMHARLQQIDWSDLRQNPLTDDALDLAYTEGVRVSEYNSKGVFMGTTVKGSYADGVVGTRVGDVMILPSGKEIPIEQAMLYSEAFHPLLSQSDFNDSGALALVSQGDGLYTTQTGNATVTQAFVDKFQAAGRQIEIAQGAGILGQGDDLSDLSGVVDDVVPGAPTQSASTSSPYAILEGPTTPEQPVPGAASGATAEASSAVPESNIYATLEGPTTPEQPVPGAASGATAEASSTVPEGTVPGSTAEGTSSPIYATLEGPTAPEQPVPGATAVGEGVATAEVTPVPSAATAELTPLASESIEVNRVYSTSAELSEVVDDVGETTGGSVEDLTRSVEVDTPPQGTSELAEANPPPQTQSVAEVVEADTPPQTQTTAETGAKGRPAEVSEAAESRQVVTRKEAFANQQNAKESGGLFSRKKLVVREVETEGGKFYETTTGQLVSTDSKGVQVVSSADQRFWAFDESILQGVELETITPEQAFRHAQMTGTLGPDGQLIVRDVPGGEGYVQTVTSGVVSKAELQQAGLFQTGVIVENPTSSVFQNTEDFAALAQRGSAGTEGAEAIGGGLGSSLDDTTGALDDFAQTGRTSEVAEANPPPQTQTAGETGAEVSEAAESRQVVTRKEAFANQQNAKESGGVFGRKKLVVREVETEGGRFYETTSGQLLSTDSKTGLQVVSNNDVQFSELDYSRLDLDTIHAQAEQVRLQTNLGAPPPGIEPPPLPSEVTPVSSVSAEVTQVSSASAELTPVSSASAEVTQVSSASAELGDSVGNTVDDVGNAAETTGGSGSVEDLTRGVEADTSPQGTAQGAAEVVEADTPPQGAAQGAGEAVEQQPGQQPTTSSTGEEITEGAEGRTAEGAGEAVEQQSGQQPTTSSTGEEITEGAEGDEFAEMSTISDDVRNTADTPTQSQGTTESVEQTGRVETDTQATAETAEQTGRVETDTQATAETAEQTGRVETDTQATAETAEQTGRVETDTQATAETAEQTGRVETDTQATAETAEQTGRVETDTQATAETAEQTGRVETDTQATAETAEQTGRVETDTQATAETAEQTGRVETDTQATAETAEQTGRVETDTQATAETAEQTGRVETDTQATAETAEQTGRVETDTQATAETAEQTGRVETDTQATAETAEQTGRVETDTQATAETAEQTGRVETDTQATTETGAEGRTAEGDFNGMEFTISEPETAYANAQTAGGLTEDGALIVRETRVGPYYQTVNDELILISEVEAQGLKVEVRATTDPIFDNTIDYDGLMADPFEVVADANMANLDSSDLRWGDGYESSKWEFSETVEVQQPPPDVDDFEVTPLKKPEFLEGHLYLQNDAFDIVEVQGQKYLYGAQVGDHIVLSSGQTIPVDQIESVWAYYDVKPFSIIDAGDLDINGHLLIVYDEAGIPYFRGSDFEVTQEFVDAFQRLGGTVEFGEGSGAAATQAVGNTADNAVGQYVKSAQEAYEFAQKGGGVNEDGALIVGRPSQDYYRTVNNELILISDVEAEGIRVEVRDLKDKIFSIDETPFIRPDQRIDFVYGAPGQPNGIIAMQVAAEVDGQLRVEFILPSGQTIAVEDAQAFLESHNTKFESLYNASDFDDNNVLLLDMNDVGEIRLRHSRVEVSDEFLYQYKRWGRAVDIRGSEFSGNDITTPLSQSQGFGSIEEGAVALGRHGGQEVDAMTAYNTALIGGEGVNENGALIVRPRGRHHYFTINDDVVSKTDLAVNNIEVDIRVKDDKVFRFSDLHYLQPDQNLDIVSTDGGRAIIGLDGGKEVVLPGGSTIPTSEIDAFVAQHDATFQPINIADDIRVERINDKEVVTLLVNTDDAGNLHLRNSGVEVSNEFVQHFERWGMNAEISGGEGQALGGAADGFAGGALDDTVAALDDVVEGQPPALPPKPGAVTETAEATAAGGSGAQLDAVAETVEGQPPALPPKPGAVTETAEATAAGGSGAQLDAVAETVEGQPPALPPKPGAVTETAEATAAGGSGAQLDAVAETVEGQPPALPPKPGTVTETAEAAAAGADDAATGGGQGVAAETQQPALTGETGTEGAEGRTAELAETRQPAKTAAEEKYESAAWQFNDQKTGQESLPPSLKEDFRVTDLQKPEFLENDLYLRSQLDYAMGKNGKPVIYGAIVGDTAILPSGQTIPADQLDTVWAFYGAKPASIVTASDVDAGGNLLIVSQGGRFYLQGSGIEVTQDFIDTFQILGGGVSVDDAASVAGGSGVLDQTATAAGGSGVTGNQAAALDNVAEQPPALPPKPGAVTETAEATAAGGSGATGNQAAALDNVAEQPPALPPKPGAVTETAEATAAGGSGAQLDAVTETVEADPPPLPPKPETVTETVEQQPSAALSQAQATAEADPPPLPPKPETVTETVEQQPSAALSQAQATAEADPPPLPPKPETVTETVEQQPSAALSQAQATAEADPPPLPPKPETVTETVEQQPSAALSQSQATAEADPPPLPP